MTTLIKNELNHKQDALIAMQRNLIDDLKRQTELSDQIIAAQDGLIKELRAYLAELQELKS